ncbi:hypothetical protein PZS07_22550, partial [Providencia thailandensis]
FTAEFGMGSGGTTALLPPDKFGFVPVRVDTANQNCNLEQADFLAPLYLVRFNNSSFRLSKTPSVLSG